MYICFGSDIKRNTTFNNAPIAHGVSHTLVDTQIDWCHNGYGVRHTSVETKTDSTIANGVRHAAVTTGTDASIGHGVRHASEAIQTDVTIGHELGTQQKLHIIDLMRYIGMRVKTWIEVVSMGCKRHLSRTPSEVIAYLQYVFGIKNAAQCSAGWARLRHGSRTC